MKKEYYLIIIGLILLIITSTSALAQTSNSEDFKTTIVSFGSASTGTSEDYKTTVIMGGINTISLGDDYKTIISPHNKIEEEITEDDDVRIEAGAGGGTIIQQINLSVIPETIIDDITSVVQEPPKNTLQTIITNINKPISNTLPKFTVLILLIILMIISSIAFFGFINKGFEENKPVKASLQIFLWIILIPIITTYLIILILKSIGL